MHLQSNLSRAAVDLNETRLSPKQASLACGSSRGSGEELCYGASFGLNHRYELAEPLGVGGSAVVYRVHDRVHGCARAAKFPFATPGRFGEFSLRLEGEILARLTHENIVALIDGGSVGGAPFLILEYVAGDTLASALAKSRFTPLQATRILIDVAAGLGQAHRRGILHLDIKPSNLILAHAGRTKIIDFGAGSLPSGATTVSAEELVEEAPLPAIDGPVHATRFVKGTIQYMAPEQWGMAPSKPQMDLWAAGMLYYELLTGQLPFGTQPACLRLRATQLERVPFSAERLGLPLSIERIMSRTLTLEPEERFASAATLSESLAIVEAELARGKGVDVPIATAAWPNTP